jgi:RNA polymerase sigma factor (sigma-70 family)
MPTPFECALVVNRAIAGDESAWAELVRQFGGRLRLIGAGFRLTPAEADDAMQMTWLELFRSIGKLESTDKVGAWLSTTMRRNCLRIVGGRRAERLTEAMEAQAVDRAAGAEDLYLLAERDKSLWEIVERLPPRQARLLRALFTEQQPSYHEIATSLSMPVGAIGPVRQRALRRLATLLADADDLALSR